MVSCVSTSTKTQHGPKLQVLTSSYFPLPARSNHPKSIKSVDFTGSTVLPHWESVNLRTSVSLNERSRSMFPRSHFSSPISEPAAKLRKVQIMKAQSISILFILSSPFGGLLEVIFNASYVGYTDLLVGTIS